MLPWFQICSLLALSLLTLLIALIPYIFVRCYRREKITSESQTIPRLWFYCLLLFAATIIATTGIVHVIPNAIESMDNFRDGLSYPYVYIIASFTLLACWTLDILLDPENSSLDIGYDYSVSQESVYPTTTPYFFSIALILHSLLEGIVLGSSPIEQATSKKYISKYLYIIFVVLGVHKALEAFSLGIIYEVYLFTSYIKFVALFLLSIATSIGVIVGLFLSDVVNNDLPIISGIICSIAAGIYIYSGVTLLMHKPPGWGRGNFRFLSILLGWILPCSISWLIYLNL